jgi:hypothetical protein
MRPNHLTGEVVELTRKLIGTPGHSKVWKVEWRSLITHGRRRLPMRTDPPLSLFDVFAEIPG